MFPSSLPIRIFYFLENTADFSFLVIDFLFFDRAVTAPGWQKGSYARQNNCCTLEGPFCSACL